MKPRLVAVHRVEDYVSVVVHQVVGQLQLVERDDVLHPLGATLRRARVHVDAAGQVRVRLARDHPARAVEGVAVALVVEGHEVHHEHVVGVGVHVG